VTALKPVWTHSFERGVEWCAPVGGPPATGLLVCTKDARLDLIGLQIGQSLLVEAIPVQPGTQFAGATGNVAYGYGHTQVCAFLVSSDDRSPGQSPRLLWQVAAAPKAQTQGDPEFLTRVIAAAATPNGVMIVRSDGQVAELCRADASVRWQHGLPGFSACKLHVCDTTAVLLWKDGEALRVAFFDLSAKEPQPTVTTIEQSLPIWTGLAGDRLVAVWLWGFAIIQRDGKPRFHTLDGVGSFASAANVAIYPAAAPQPNETGADVTPGSALLLLQSAGGFVYARDLATGELRWPQSALRPSAGPVGASSSLKVVGDLVLATNRLGLGVWAAATGRRLAWPEREGRAICGGVNEGVAYALSLDPRRPDRQTGGRSMRIVRQSLSAAAAPRADQPGAREPREFVLGQAESLRDTFWLGSSLLVVEDKRVRVYTLP
jgi:hypothetical protein